MKKVSIHKAKGWRSLLNFREALRYEHLIENSGFIFFLAALAILYIWNRHRTERNVIETNKANKELSEYIWEYTSLKSELNNRSMQSEVAEKVATFGLEELRQPPVKLDPNGN